MGSYTLNELIEQVGGELLRQGLPQHTIKRVSAGFYHIRKLHTELGVHKFSSTATAELVCQKRADSKRGVFLRETYWKISRCAGWLEELSRYGHIELKWRDHDWQYQYDPIKMAATDEQIGDPDNIYGLVCRVRQTLVEAGFSKFTRKNYNVNGFDKILRHYQQLGITQYDKAITDSFVLAEHERALRENIHRVRQSILRKVASFLYMYNTTGRITFEQLSPIKTTNPNPDAMSLLGKYIDFISKTIGYSASSLNNRRNTIRRYMLAAERLGHSRFSEFTLPDAKRCLMEYLQPGSGKTHLLYPIRDFLKYLYEEKVTTLDLSIVIPRNYSPKRTVREGYSNHEIGTLLNGINQQTAIGKRDFAIITLASRTGLRGCDISNLKFANIDWRLNEIGIVQQKTGQPIKIPLTAEVGNAIAEYIMNGRPDIKSPHIFLRHKRPYEKLSYVSRIIPRWAESVNKDGQFVPNRGFHGFRRSFGVGLLKIETPLHLISEMLGVRKMDSIKPYLAIHDEGLKNCALPLIRATGSEAK